MSDSQQVKFLAGLKSDLASKASQSGLTPGALYFCTDEKKIFKATANNAYEAVNEEVSFGVLPEAANAFPGKLYLRQADMTLHVVNEAKDGFKQLSAPADALTPDKVSEDLEADDKKLLASKAAVKAGIKVVADDLADEITNRTTGDTQTLANAKKYADDQDKILAGNYNTAGEGVDSNASGLRKEIEERIAAEAKLRSDADKGLAGRLDEIEGEGEGSIKAAVKAEKERAEAAEKVLTDNLADEVSARTEADTALDTRITKLEGDANTPGSVASQIKEVKDQIKDIKDTVGHEAVPGDDEGQGAQAASGLFAKLDEEVARAKGEETRIEGLLDKEVTRAKTAEEANKAAIEAEKTRAMAAEAANKTVLDKLDGEVSVEGSVKKQIKDAVDAEAALRVEKDNELQGAIDNINDALGLGGATGSTSISSRLDAVEGRATALEGRADTLEGKVSTLETAVGTKKVGEQEATGLYKDIDDLQAKDTELKTAIDTLNGDADTAGSVAKAVADEAKLRKDADDALDARLDVIEASIGTGGDLEKRVAANEAKLLVVQGDENTNGSINKALKDAKSYADQKITDLVNGAPEAMDTLKELADAISTHQGVYEAYVKTVATNIADAKQEAKDYADQKDGELHTAITGEINTAVKAEADRAKGVEASLRTDVDSKVAKTDYDTKVAELEQADTANLAEAKKYADDQDKILAGNYNTAAVDQPSNASGLRGEIETKIAAEKTERVAADEALQGAIDDINAALGLGEGATAGVGTRLNNLEAAVGTPAVEGDPGTPATGFYKDIDNLKAADTALDGRLDSLEGVVGDAQSGLVKDVADNTAAIATINGEGEGSIKKALEDAKAYADQAEADAIKTAEAKAKELDTALKTEIEKEDGVLMTAIKAEETRADSVEKGLDTRLKAVEASIKEDGALGSKVAAIKTQVDLNTAAIGDENSGLVKDVATNAGNIATNAAAIEAINNVDTGILAQAKADATTKANNAKNDAITEAGKLDAALKTELQGYADQAEADALADAKEYVDEKIGTASVPGEGEAQGTAATGLHKVIEDKDAATLAAAKTYADTAADKATTEALTWGTF